MSTLLSIVAATPAAAATPRSEWDYVALGDSYSSGVGASGQTGLCLRSANGYPGLWKAANDPRWQAMVDGHWDSDEDEETFRRRTIESIESIIVRHPGERVAAACHGGVINLYLGHVLGLPAETRGFFYPNYTSIHRVAAARSGQRSLLSLNEIAHLRGTGLAVGLFGSA
jgi:hypothetical protein